MDPNFSKLSALQKRRMILGIYLAVLRVRKYKMYYCPTPEHLTRYRYQLRLRVLSCTCHYYEPFS